MNESIVYKLDEKIKHILFEDCPFKSKDIFKIRFLNKKDIKNLIDAEIGVLNESISIIESLEEFMDVNSEKNNLDDKLNLFNDYLIEINKHEYFVVRLKDKNRIDEILEYLDFNLTDSFNFYLKKYLEDFHVDELKGCENDISND